MSRKNIFFIFILIISGSVYGLEEKNKSSLDSSTPSITSKINEPLLKLENEKNTINIVKKSIYSVVNISNIKTTRLRPWGTATVDIPAGAGSGFVWDDKGHIVTNFHVVAGGDKFNVSFHNDEKQYRAKLVGGEQKEDTAVLKLLTFPVKLNSLPKGVSSTLQVGQKAIAIGNPFGLDSTITEGIVSALGRKIPGFGNVKIHNMIQTDSSINPGNSGGPLLNSSGEVIGMNTLIYSPSGSSAGVGFSIPIDALKRTVPQLIKYGKVIRPFLGLVFFDRGYQEQFGINKGLAIKYVYDNSPADKAGLKGLSRDRRGRYFLGDILLSIDKNIINSYDEIFHVLDKYKVGGNVTLRIIRDEKIMQKKVKLGSN